MGAVRVVVIVTAESALWGHGGYLVDKDDKVNERVVTADRAINGEWLITAGLNAGERVVLDGLQKIKPGSPVKPVPAAEQGNAATHANADAASEVAKR